MNGKTRVAVSAALGAIAVLSLMDALVRQASMAAPVLFVVFMRYVTGMVFAILACAASRAPWPTIGSLKRAALRSLFILATAALFFITLKLMPLAQAVALTFTAPFFMVFGSALVLGEPISSRAILASLIGFGGIVLMVAGRLFGSEQGDLIGYGTAIAASVTYAGANILLRRDSAHDPVPTMILAQNAMVTLLALPLGLFWFTLPTASGLGLMILSGALGTAGHLLFAQAYSRAEANVLAPLEFTGFLWASLFGLLFFSEIPTLWTLAGTVLIVGACLIVVLDRRVKT